MPRFPRLGIPRLGSVFCLTAAFLAVAAADEKTASNEHGWSILLEARDAAGTGPSGTPLRDYTYDLVTRTQTANGEVQLQSSSFFLAPTWIRQEIHAPTGEIVMIFDGGSAWQVVPAGRRELPAAMVEQFRSDLSRSHVLSGPLPPKDAVYFLRQESVENRLADVIEIREIGGTPLRLSIDAETRDLLKTTYVGDTPAGMAQVEEFYSDYTEAGGIRWYQKKRVVRNGQLAQQSTRKILKVNSSLTKEDILR
jgi:hypothetical protein